MRRPRSGPRQRGPAGVLLDDGVAL